MNETTKIRIFVAEDHGIVREGIRLLIEAQPDMEVVGEASNGQEAVDQARELRPDVMLVDLGMPLVSGLDVIKLIKKHCPETRALVLTIHNSDDYFFRSLDAGASGYVLKGAASADLLQAIRAAHRCEIYLHPSMSTKLVADYLRRVKSGQERDTYDALTEREKEVLRLIAEGYTNQEISSMLTLSPSTVQTHRAHLMEKLNLRTRTDLIKYAIRKKLIEVDS
ncbi:MAG: response regulator transcription factor [Chloroflexi bacterium]|nr:response regulator transcription factor [Chloroflexota bacterium]